MEKNDLSDVRIVTGPPAAVVLVAMILLLWPSSPAQAESGAGVAAAPGAMPARQAMAAVPLALAGGAAAPATLRQRFERDEGLYALATDLGGTHDAEALWTLAKIVDYCSAFAVNAAGFRADTDVLSRGVRFGGAEVVKASRERVERRCRRFDGPDSRAAFGRNGTVVLKTAAARAGSLAAEVDLLRHDAPLSKDPDAVRALVDRAIASRDPDVYLALSHVMDTRAAGRQARFGRFSGTEAMGYAWQLAACRLGLDCGPRGALMTVYCVNAGICVSESDVERLVVNHLVPHAQAAHVRQTVGHILRQR